MSLAGLAHEARVNGDKIKRHFDMLQAKGGECPSVAGSSSGGSVVDGLANLRKGLQATLSAAPSPGEDLSPRVASLEKENASMKSELAKLKAIVDELTKKMGGVSVSNGPAKVPAKAPAKPAAKAAESDDDDVDLFGSDEEDDEEKEAIKKARVEAYAAKKAKKPALIAKSSIILDVKPWEAETDMAAMEKDIRSIAMDGLVWGAGKLVPVAYGVKKLQIMCVVEDEKVSIDSLTEQIEAFEDYVQSVDIAAFNKI